MRFHRRSATRLCAILAICSVGVGAVAASAAGSGCPRPTWVHQLAGLGSGPSASDELDAAHWGHSYTFTMGHAGPATFTLSHRSPGAGVPLHMQLRQLDPDSDTGAGTVVPLPADAGGTVGRLPSSGSDLAIAPGATTAPTVTLDAGRYSVLVSRGYEVALADQAGNEFPAPPIAFRLDLGPKDPPRQVAVTTEIRGQRRDGRLLLRMRPSAFVTANVTVTFTTPRGRRVKKLRVDLDETTAEAIPLRLTRTERRGALTTTVQVDGHAEDDEAVYAAQASRTFTWR